MLQILAKKKQALILIVVMSLLIVIGEYIGDFDNFILSGSGYKLINYSDDHIFLVREKDNKRVIEEQIVDFERNGDNLLVLRMVAESMDCYDDGVPTIITHYSDVKEYWIINLVAQTEKGPFDEQVFNETLVKLGISDVALDVPKSYRQNTDVFNKSCGQDRAIGVEQSKQNNRGPNNRGQ